MSSGRNEYLFLFCLFKYAIASLNSKVIFLAKKDRINSSEVASCHTGVTNCVSHNIGILYKTDQMQRQAVSDLRF